MIKVNDLLEIGLTPSEAKVYSCLATKKFRSVAAIRIDTRLARNKIYETLKRLVEKKLIIQRTVNRVKRFRISDASNLDDVLRPKIASLDLVKKQIQHLEQDYTEICDLTGRKEVRNVFYRFLSKKEPILAWHCPLGATQKMLDFFDVFHEKRIEKKIPMKHIYDLKATQRIKRLKEMSHTEVRTLDQMPKLPAAINVCGDEIVLIHFDAEPISAIRIKNKKLAQDYKEHFNKLWRRAKE